MSRLFLYIKVPTSSQTASNIGILNVMKLSYISPAAEHRGSDIEGKGLFARKHIKQGSIVAVKGGHVFDNATLKELSKTLGPAEIQIADDLFIGPVSQEERDGAMLYLNHSCNPNVGVDGQIIFVAIKDIAPEEELTFDYAMTDDEEYQMECNCNAPNCRKVITGRDWQKPELQSRYGKYFSSYLLKKFLQ